MQGPLAVSASPTVSVDCSALWQSQAKLPLLTINSRLLTSPIVNSMVVVMLSLLERPSTCWVDR